jgi:hypothetical protein
MFANSHFPPLNPKSSAAPASSLALSGAPVATMVAPADPADSGGLGSGDAKRRAENERSADALFESRSLDEIREVRARAARDAEAKDEELRQRVGSSYRDAIATADCVLEMETTAARATTTLDEAVRVLTALPDAVKTIERGAAEAVEKQIDLVKPSSSSLTDDDALYAAGTRVKFLVDTPEKIWGSLEARDRVSAARRFLAARDVLSVLDGEDHVVRAFPLVKQQAPLLESFRAQISRAARSGLADVTTSRLNNTETNFVSDVADALAALVAAENLGANEALRVFLQTRRAWVRAALRSATLSSCDGKSGKMARKRAKRKGKGADAERDAKARQGSVARALAAACREARRVPGALVACFGGADFFALEKRRGDAFADDELENDESEDDFATLARWGAPAFASETKARRDGEQKGTAERAEDAAAFARRRARRPLLLAAVEALDGPTDGAETSAPATATSPTDESGKPPTDEKALRKRDGEDDGEGGGEKEEASPSRDFSAEKNAAASSSAETFRGIADPREETALRAARAKRRLQTLGAVPMRLDALSQAYREWLAGVAEDVAASGVFGGIESLKELADVERRVEAAESKALLSSGSSLGRFGVGELDAAGVEDADSARADADRDPDGYGPGGSGRAARLSFACERARLALLGAGTKEGALASPASPWASLVEAPHAARARELLSGAFQFASLRAATEALLAATRAPPRRASPLAPSPEGRTLWTEGFRARADEDDDGEAKRALSRETRASREAREARSAPAPPTRRAAETLAKALASDLARTRRDVVAFASANGNRDGTLADAVRGRRSETMSSERARAAKKRVETRLARLESFAHAECAAGVKSYAAFLEAKLDALSNALEAERENRAVETPTPESAAAAERVLLIALAASVASEELSEELSSFLGPASSWDRAEEEADGGGAGTLSGTLSRARARRRAAARGAVPGGALASTTAALRAVADRGFRRWADRAARSIRIELERALLADASLVSEERREDWEEEPEAAAAEIAARLPALASPYAFAAAHAACAEALRCGGHALPPAAARALAAAAVREALAAYRARLDGSLRESVKSVSEKGALQALFDVKFLYETFHEDPSGASRQDSSRGEEDADAALARANALALRGVVAAASAALDPIDWATYEAPLWRAVARARARTTTVLGLANGSGGVGTLNEALSKRDAATFTGAGTAPPPPPRFSYLPVGAPAARFRTRGSFETKYGRAGSVFSLDGDRRNGAGATLVDWSAAGFDAFGETEGPDSLSRDGNAGGNFFGKLAGVSGLGFIRAL